jgi:hypothetical protein
MLGRIGHLSNLSSVNELRNWAVRLCELNRKDEIWTAASAVERRSLLLQRCAALRTIFASTPPQRGRRRGAEQTDVSCLPRINPACPSAGSVIKFMKWRRSLGADDVLRGFGGDNEN